MLSLIPNLSGYVSINWKIMPKSKSPKPQAKRPTNQGLLRKHRPCSAERPGPFQIFHCNSWLLRWDNTCRAGWFREHSTGGWRWRHVSSDGRNLATRTVCEFQGYHLWSDDQWSMPKKTPCEMWNDPIIHFWWTKSGAQLRSVKTSNNSLYITFWNIVSS